MNNGFEIQCVSGAPAQDRKSAEPETDTELVEEILQLTEQLELPASDLIIAVSSGRKTDAWFASGEDTPAPSELLLEYAKRLRRLFAEGAVFGQILRPLLLYLWATDSVNAGCFYPSRGSLYEPRTKAESERINQLADRVYQLLLREPPFRRADWRDIPNWTEVLDDKTGLIASVRFHRFRALEKKENAEELLCFARCLRQQLRWPNVLDQEAFNGMIVILHEFHSLFAEGGRAFQPHSKSYQRLMNDFYGILLYNK